MRPLTILILGLFLLITSCEQVEKQQQTTVFIYVDPTDTATVKFNQAIMQLPEYGSWKYNYSNSDTSKIIGYSYFEKRKVVSNNETFYHIELFRKKFNKVIDSFMYPDELVCYFRVYQTDNIIRILNKETTQFLDLMSIEGRDYLKTCLAK